METLLKMWNRIIDDIVRLLKAIPPININIKLSTDD